MTKPQVVFIAQKGCHMNKFLNKKAEFQVMNPEDFIKNYFYKGLKKKHKNNFTDV